MNNMHNVMSKPARRVARILLMLWGLCGVLVSSNALALTVETLQNSGPSANRVDIVILGDGYRAQDQAQLTADATNLMNGFWAQPVFAAYRNFFNVKLIHVISNENGADNGSFGALRDTALDAHFNCFNIDRLLCVSDSKTIGAALTDVPEFDQILVVVNDPKYGGSGGQLATSSIHPDGGLITVHEIGHSLVHLADEYVDTAAGFPRCSGECPEANATTATTLATIKWNQWIDPGTPLTHVSGGVSVPGTPDTPMFDGVVGLFEGARYYPTDQYRPFRNCIMRAFTPTPPRYCPVCSEQVTLTAYGFASPVDAKSPATDAVSMSLADTVKFEVPGPRAIPNTTLVRWLVDAVEVASGTSSEHMFSGAALGVGVHAVQAILLDQTTFVRRDDNGVLGEVVNWTVTVKPPPCGFVGDSAAKTLCTPEPQSVALNIEGDPASCTGRLISRDGKAITPGVPIVNGAVLLVPGAYVVEWTNPTGTKQQPLTVTLTESNACCSAQQTIITGSGAANAIVPAGSQGFCVFALGGQDFVQTASGADLIFGGTDGDFVVSGSGADIISGGAGEDSLSGSSGGTLRAIGGSGDDAVSAVFSVSSQLYGGPGKDNLTGSAGNDFLAPGGGIDQVTAGTGNDTVVLYSSCEAGSGEKLNGGTGTDTLIIPMSLASLNALGTTTTSFENVVVNTSQAYLSDCF